MTVRTGLDRVAAGETALPHAARLALLSNRAARTSDGRWALDALRDAGYDIRLLLGPEHGVDLAADAGATVGHSRLGDIPVLSLYGADLAPVEEALGDIDLIVADLLDVGARYYTYPWTIRETMRLAAAHDVAVTILDRPNPLGGTAIEGNLPELDSPVCASRVPIRHGLTLGELSLWNRNTYEIPVQLDVIPLTGWRRQERFDATGLPWVPPSPALPDLEAVTLYPGTCLIEGTTLSEGRGTDAPFRQFGSPHLDAEAVIAALQTDEAMAGLSLSAVRFTPTASKWAGEACAGIRLSITDADALRPVRAGLAIIGALRAADDFAFLPFFDLLAGTPRWREVFENGGSPSEITAGLAADEEGFRKARRDVLLYDRDAALIAG